MNIFVIIGAIASVIIGDLSNIQGLIAAKNWTGLASNILGLVQSALGTLFPTANGVEASPEHVQKALAKLTPSSPTKH